MRGPRAFGAVWGLAELILNNIMSTGRYLRGIQDHNNVAGDAFLAMLRSWPLEYIAVAGEELAKFAGFIDDKGLVGQLPQFQLTEYDTHDVRVTTSSQSFIIL